MERSLDQLIDEILMSTQKQIDQSIARFGKTVKDKDQLEVECKLAVWRAILDYDEDFGVPWRTYIFSVLKNCILNIIRQEQRLKRSLDSLAVSLEEKISTKDGSAKVEDIIPDGNKGSEDSIEFLMTKIDIQRFAVELSNPKQGDIILAICEGFELEDIADVFDYSNSGSLLSLLKRIQPVLARKFEGTK